MATKWINRLEIVLSLGLVLGCLGALAALGATVMIAFFGTATGIGVPLHVHDVPVPVLPVPGAEIVSAAAEVTVRPVGASPAAALFYLLQWAPPTATGLLALFTVVRALRRARSGDRALFSATTAGHLRRLGWILIAGSLVSAVSGTVAQAILSGMLLMTGQMFDPPPGGTLVALVAGLCALGVSEIVRRGVVLLDEVEATI
ncbi:DUF2975 domain-containing protein [Nonomuraea spiralis]|uniref:DUF2975 domain-containing protein n=1 Tax=Nonomuraea spiralis TaxID=46182 RepID=A0ABV5IZ77_9ACTN|nr:DUF2975 domain-containing protein [Nonomuraea spiralis]GGS86289.1 hypothetical protein GCM10010176_032390 [Nonomuraea spiralis]